MCVLNVPGETVLKKRVSFLALLNLLIQNENFEVSCLELNAI